MKHAGLQRNAAYLVRPDGYVALADPDGSAAAIVGFRQVCRWSAQRFIQVARHR